MILNSKSIRQVIYMRQINLKRLVAVLLCIEVLLTSMPVVNAASIPAKYDDPKYIVDGRVDYKNLYALYFKYLTGNADLVPPTASFTVTVKRGGTEVASGTSDSGTILYAQVGDTLTITNTSKASPGNTLSKCDFQVSDGMTIKQTTSLGSIVSTFNANINTSVEGVYNIYLNVMDNTTLNTEGWGNWDYRGTHRTPGINPGGGTGSDFPGWWYYCKLTIDIRKPEYTVQEKHVDMNTGSVLDAVNHSGITDTTYTTASKSFFGYDFVGSRAGYSWEDIASGTTENITSRTAEFDISRRNAFHYYYYKASAPPPPPPAGKADIAVYYKNKATEESISPADTTTYKGVSYGTYTINAKVISGYTLDTSSSPSPQSVTVSSSYDRAAVVFYYNGTTPPPPPAKEPPTAILDTPEEVMAGEVVKADGSDSWSNNPGGCIEDYYFEYEGANLESDNGSNVRIWYPAIGTYEIYLEVEDENGKHDSMENEIEVTPPIPTAVITVTGKLKENRKVTVSSSSSTSTKYYPIDETKTVWAITPVSGGTAADIKYLGALTGVASKDLLFKKAGTYRIRLTVYNTYGLSVTASQTITISPDLPPIAKIQLPTPAGVPYKTYRDPDNSNYAAAQIFNESYSPDGDTINKVVVLYCYDSDNDGDYKDEQWYYSKDGTTWISTGMNYTNTVSSFNIYNIATSNISTFTLKSKAVGRYHFAIRVMETIPAADTIPAFIIESDYKRDDDF